MDIFVIAASLIIPTMISWLLLSMKHCRLAGNSLNECSRCNETTSLHESPETMPGGAGGTAPTYGLIFPVTAMWAVAVWAPIGAEVLPMPMIWNGLYGNAFTLLSIIAIPLIWLAAMVYATTIRATAAATGRKYDKIRVRSAVIAAAGLPLAFIIHYALLGFKIPHAEIASLLYSAVLFRAGWILVSPGSHGDNDLNIPAMKEFHLL